MTTDGGPIELDKDILYKEPEKKSDKRPKKIPVLYIVAGMGFILIVALLFVNPQGKQFIDSPPEAEQAERDSVFAAALLIEQYLNDTDSLPGPGDISIPSNCLYEKEDQLEWSIETEEGLYYSSDMDLQSFKTGVL